MRTLVELLDKEPIENVIGSCVFQPEIVVFLCDASDSTFFKESAIYRLFKRRKLRTRPRFYYFDTTNVAQIKRVLAAVWHDFPDCVFDFTGGSDLLLLFAGNFCIENKVPGYYIDLSRERFVNVQECEQLAPDFAVPGMMAEDVFALTGASIQGNGHFDALPLQPEFEQEALQVWQVVQRNPHAWGIFVGYLQAVCAGSGTSQTLVTASASLHGKGAGMKANPAILDALARAGVLRWKRENGGIQIEFKSLLHKKSLLNHGIWLELYCYVQAKLSNEFDDVRTSIVIDWDGVDGGADNTKNEVDVFCTRGVVPVFISCKMSAPSALALSEIRLLSLKFGARNSRTVLLTAERLTAEHNAIVQRAADLDILLLDATDIEQGRVAEKLLSISMPVSVRHKFRPINKADSSAASIREG
ncbi:MAG: hypothetical protein ACK5JF_12030 [Oscillospiraceae bacterium]